MVSAIHSKGKFWSEGQFRLVVCVSDVGVREDSVVQSICICIDLSKSYQVFRRWNVKNMHKVELA
jgi:hypothetical protein